MKLVVIGLIVLSALGYAGCGSGEPNVVPAPTAKTPTPVPTPLIPKDGDYPGRGKVTKIDMKLGSVELDHEEIAGVMPAMKMELYVSDKAMLTGLKVGDQVDFILRYKHPTETIVKIEKSK